MPEGDTIHRAARSLRAALAGEIIIGVGGREPSLVEAGLEGLRVDSVSARGKHLLIQFEDGRTLHSHMRMEGRWHLYRPGEPMGKGVVIALETERWVAACHHAPEVRLYAAGRLPEVVRRLGPDLLDPSVDLDEAMRRLRAASERAIGDALMRQDLVSGIGNVYKSELLFLSRACPFLPISAFLDERLRRLLEEARRLMRANLRGGMRRTRRREGGRLWVYGRSGSPCYECGETILMRRQGDAGRSTYYCPACQAPHLAEPPPEGLPTRSMSLTVYQYPKCSTCRKALKWLDAKGVEYRAIDIVEAPPSQSALKKIWKASGLPIRKLFNTSGVSYREGGFKAKLETMSDAEALAALAADGKLIKRPLLVGDDFALVGFDEAAYSERLQR